MVSYPFRWVHLCKSNQHICLCSRGPWAMAICPVEKIVEKPVGTFGGDRVGAAAARNPAVSGSIVAEMPKTH